MEKVVSIKLKKELDVRNYCVGTYGTFNEIRYVDNGLGGGTIALIGLDGVAVGLINKYQSTIDRFKEMEL
jgi:hypothetical protein